MVKLTVSRSMTLIINMVTAMLISRYRTYEEYGTYSQIHLVMSLFLTLFMLGLPNSINYFLTRSNSIEEENSFLSNYYTITTFLSLALGIILSAGIRIISLYFNNEYIIKFSKYLMILPWATITMQSIDNVMVVYKRINELMIYKLVYSTLLVGIVILNHVLKHTFEDYMLAFTLLNVGGGISTLLLVNDKKHRLVPQFNVRLIRKIFIYSIPMGLSTLVGTLNAEIDKLYIGYVTNTESLAIYANAARELPITMISSSITAILLPQIIKMVKDGYVEDSVDKWKTSVEISFIATCFMVCGIFTYSKEVMTLLYSDKYLVGENIFRIYAFALLLRVTYFGMYLNALGKPQLILASSVFSLLVNAVLNPLCYMIWGLPGPAIATLIAVITMQSTQLIISSRLLKIRINRILPFRNMLVILIINVIISLLFKYLKSALHLEQLFGEIVESIILGGGWGIIYFIIFKSRIFSLWHRLNKTP